LIKIYLDSSPDLMEKIRVAVAASDGPSLTKAAHSLKSSSKNVGANKFAALCADLEQVGRDYAMEKAASLLGKTEEQFSSVLYTFRKTLHTKSEQLSFHQASDGKQF
jgi:HPt (histidine-containing phosphotransfer) domain-containing protein